MGSKKQSEVRGPRSEVSLTVSRAGRFGLRTSDFGLRTILLAASLLAVSMAWADGGRKPTVESVGNKVMCVCGGCVAPLNECPMLECAEKAEMRAYIQKEINDGKDETAILQDISIRYGVHALTAPPAKGFNLAVWILPGIGLLVGLGIVVVIVRRWKHKPADVPAPSAASLDPKVLAAMEEEMKLTGMK
ncbi:MAG: cytochrome c-type biogenesis protein CcmH [Terriglobia bacterium]